MFTGSSKMSVPAGMPRTGHILLVASMLGITGMFGCDDQKKDKVTEPPRTIAVAKKSYLEGVVVPPKFELRIDDSETWDRQSGGERFAQHVYKGKGDIHKIRQFYRDEMPGLGWFQVEDQVFDGEVMIRFEKEQEACVVRITAGGLFGNEVTIKAFVAPFSRGGSNSTPRRVP